MGKTVVVLLTLAMFLVGSLAFAGSHEEGEANPCNPCNPDDDGGDGN